MSTPDSVRPIVRALIAARGGWEGFLTWCETTRTDARSSFDITDEEWSVMCSEALSDPYEWGWSDRHDDCLNLDQYATEAEYRNGWDDANRLPSVYYRPVTPYRPHSTQMAESMRPCHSSTADAVYRGTV